jgi:hypothetical protein
MELNAAALIGCASPSNEHPGVAMKRTVFRSAKRGFQSSFATLTAASAACALGALLLPAAAQAQRSYTLTVLKPGAAGKEMGRQYFIDAQNRVYGRTEYFTGLVSQSIPFFGNLPFISGSYKFYPSRWAASTAASVSASKLPVTGDLIDVAAGGAKRVQIGLLGPAVVDTASGAQKVLAATEGGERAVLYGIGHEMGVNNLGWAAGYVKTLLGVPPNGLYDTGDTAVLWKPGQIGVYLPTAAGFIASHAYLINDQGVVAGTVFEGVPDNNRTVVTRTVRWVNGVPEVLDARPSHTSTPITLNNAGQILQCGASYENKVVVDPYSSYEGLTAVQGPSECEILSAGASIKIAGTPGRFMWPLSMNNAGTVVGGEYTDLNWLGDFAGAGGGRAVIWTNGVLQDLTALVTSKGVKLPAGVTALTVALAINDSGSIVAAYPDPKTKRAVIVRLQAQP